MEGDAIFLPPRKFRSWLQRGLFIVATPSLMIALWSYLLAFGFGGVATYKQITHRMWLDKAAIYPDAEIVEIINEADGTGYAWTRQLRVNYPKRGSKFIFEESLIDIPRARYDFQIGGRVRIAVGMDGKAIWLDAKGNGRFPLFYIIVLVLILVGVPSSWLRPALRKRLQELRLLEQGLIVEAQLVSADSTVVRAHNKPFQTQTYKFVAYNDNEYTLKKTAPKPVAGAASSVPNEIQIIYALKSPERPLILAEIDSLPSITEDGLGLRMSRAALLTALGFGLISLAVVVVYFMG